MTKPVLVMAQINPLVGDIDGNCQKILHFIEQASEIHEASLVVFPELCLTGYPPEDLLLRPSVERRVERALEKICQAVQDHYIILGYPKIFGGALYNVAGVVHRGRIIAEYCKHILPNYQVFDEKRYFTAGTEACVFEWQGLQVGLTVCEDIWTSEPIAKAKHAGANLVLNLNASPFHQNKQHERESLLLQRFREVELPVVYVNMVGGQDELVFDGGSFTVDSAGEIATRARSFEEQLVAVQLSIDVESRGVSFLGECVDHSSELESVYQALVLGMRDYVDKNRFKSTIIGLSGGIDSALTLAIAVDALGPERVKAVMMPFRYTSQLSRDEAAAQAKMLGVDYQSISIEPIYDSFLNALSSSFEGMAPDKTEENIQARSRGVILMAISNKTGALVLTTGNKSEMAVGYATLYGDMAGGFAVLKDIPKTLVYRLANFRNSFGAAIPQSVIDRPPSAELAPDQVDQDSLPEYEILDQILALYIEQDCSATQIIERGFDRDTVYHVLRLVDVNEYKRRQAAVGVRITQRGFGRDRRYPITNGWLIGD